MANNIVNICYQLGTFNYGQRPQQNSHSNNITCRLCNQVITSFQAFITHIESHFVQENHSMKGLCSPNHVNSRKEMINPNSMKSNIPRPMQETINLANNKVFRAQQESMVMPRSTTNPIYPPQAMPSARNNVAGVAMLASPPVHQRVMEISPIDRTRPFINLLEKPINNNEIVNWANRNGDSLDLTLRL
ncbi:hypothetical protein VNO77_13233 [Canavalia gladiata]|uniref:C2H2-type domain-containing protein n=1 Tax=Canavalia gladiata TaxID=3824 RepID=A0AAN9QN89_CANGL